MSKSKRINLISGSLALAVIILLVVFIMSRLERSPEPPMTTNPSPETEKPGTDIASVMPRDEPVREDVSPMPDRISAISAPEAARDVEPEEASMNSEDQPREHFVSDFTDLKELPEGYKLENIELTPEGIKLLPPKPGEENAPRFGVLESAPEEMYFASNAISPFWREDLPEDTSIFVEVTVSPDGTNWGPWNTVMPDTDGENGATNSEFYPDGSPNPYYGYTAGGLFFWGYKQYQYFRYRVNLYSEVRDSPILSGFRLYYQDSTLGKGHVAEVDAP